MRKLISFTLTASLALALGCGSDDSDDNGNVPDARPAIDAGDNVDAPPSGLMGLGQTCVAAMQGADCPMNTPACLTFAAGAVNGICTAVCLQQITFMTDGNAAPGPFMPPLTDGDATCTPLYTGGPEGIAACNVVANVNPAPPLIADTQYTAIGVCGIGCGAGDTCPSPLTCDTAAGLCTP